MPTKALLFRPLSNSTRKVQYVSALAQCRSCKQVSTYDLMDSIDHKPLRCQSGPQDERCGGELQLWQDTLGAYASR